MAVESSTYDWELFDVEAHDSRSRGVHLRRVIACDEHVREDRFGIDGSVALAADYAIDDAEVALWLRSRPEAAVAIGKQQKPGYLDD